MNIEKTGEKIAPIEENMFFRIIAGIFIVLLGWVSMLFLTSSKDAPIEGVLEENFLLVKTLRVEPKDYPVRITGYGVSKSISSMFLAPEVSGKVVFVNPNMKVGGVIFPGEVLFKLDDLDYTIVLCEAEENVIQCESFILKLKNQQSIDTHRVDTLNRNKAIAFFEFEQIKKLFEEHNIGTKLDVMHSEKFYNLACDSLDQIKGKVSQYFIQIEEAKSKLKSAKANLTRARNNLGKCQIMASFCSRVKSFSIEIGEVLSVGQKVAELADDSILEIQVSLDSNDVKQWLQFDLKSTAAANQAWFEKLISVPCEIIWNSGNSSCKWTGYLDRVAGFDQKSRTIKIVVKIGANSIHEKREPFPLVEGMFCSVNIPGRMMKNVYCLPRQSVSFENKVNLFDENNRLRIVPVTILRVEGDNVFISEGLSSSDIIVRTRLVDPVEGTLLKLEGKILQGPLN